jgi:hypothetical protein
VKERQRSTRKRLYNYRFFIFYLFLSDMRGYGQTMTETCIEPEANLVYAYIGVYGDVHRVKILFNKKDSALIQFATPQQAAIGKFATNKTIMTIVFSSSASKSRSCHDLRETNQDFILQASVRSDAERWCFGKRNFAFSIVSTDSFLRIWA